MKLHFTHKTLESIAAGTKRFEVGSASDPGFRLRVHPSGRKSFVYRYKLGGRVRVVVLGQFPAMSLREARAAYSDLRSRVDEGEDVAASTLTAKQEERDAETVSELAAEYIERHAKPKKRSWREDQRILHRELLPLYGHLKARDVRRRDIVRLIDHIVDRGSPIQANRTLAVIRKCFNFAIERGLLEHSPCLQIKAPGAERSRERVLEEFEIVAFWTRLHETNMCRTMQLALKFQLVTAQRKGEALAARFSEIEGDWWTIPAERSKNGRTHRVPLGSLAQAILAEARELSDGSDYVFPSPARPGQALDDTAVNHGVRRAWTVLGVTAWTPHDLRRTAATKMTEAGIPRLPHVECVLNHADRSVGAVYDRHTYEPEKREALETWDRRLRDILGRAHGSNVAQLT